MALTTDTEYRSNKDQDNYTISGGAIEKIPYPNPFVRFPVTIRGPRGGYQATVFLSADEAAALAQALLKAVADYKRGVPQ